MNKIHIGGLCPSCGTQKEYGLCPNKECSVWTFGSNLEDYDMFFEKAKRRYSKTHIRVKGYRNEHSKTSKCPTCEYPMNYKKEPTQCYNCDQLLEW